MTYTDYFGQPLAVGDEIIYPVAGGANRAAFERCPIVALVPLIQHRDNPKHLMREDQISHKRPTVYGSREDPSKRFVIQVLRKPRWAVEGAPPKKFSIPYVENVIRVPDGC